jgi:hypothetical protein
MSDQRQTQLNEPIPSRLKRLMIYLCPLASALFALHPDIFPDLDTHCSPVVGVIDRRPHLAGVGRLFEAFPRERAYESEVF